MPLEMEELEHLNEYLDQAKSLLKIVGLQLELETELPQDKVILTTLHTSLVRALDDVSAVADGLVQLPADHPIYQNNSA